MRPHVELDPRQACRELREAHEARRFEFVMVELDLALTYCEVAMSADDQSKADRHTENAKRAYLTVLRLLSEASFTPEMSHAVIQRLLRLSSLLQDLDAAASRIVRRSIHT